MGLLGFTQDKIEQQLQTIEIQESVFRNFAKFTEKPLRTPPIAASDTCKGFQNLP